MSGAVTFLRILVVDQRIVEGRNADLVIGSEQFPFRGDAAHVRIVRMGEGGEEQGTEQGKAGVWFKHGVFPFGLAIGKGNGS